MQALFTLTHTYARTRAHAHAHTQSILMICIMYRLERYSLGYCEIKFKKVPPLYVYILLICCLFAGLCVYFDHYNFKGIF